MFARRALRIMARGYVTTGQGPKVSPEDMKVIAAMPFYRSFMEGVDLTRSNSLEEANGRYQRALNQLQERKEQMMEHYIHIQKKIIQNNYALRKGKALQDSLYALIKARKQAKTNPVFVYDDYSTLFAAMLEFNPAKAALLGKALLSEKTAADLPIKHRKQFQFSLGNAYMLLGNYADAKLKYGECLDSVPGQDLKARVLNNLGLACWWHKNPLLAEVGVAPGANKEDLVDGEFRQTRQIFLKSIQTGQDIEELEEESRKGALTQAIEEQQFDPEVSFTGSSSVLPLYNLSQYYIHNEPHHKLKIMFWLGALLKASQTHEQFALFDEAYATLALLNNQQDRLKQVVPQMAQKYKGRPQEIYFSKINMFLASSTGNREEAGKIQRRIASAEQQLQDADPVVFKRKYLSVLPFTI